MKVVVDKCEQTVYDRHRTYHVPITIDCSISTSGLIVVSSDPTNHACGLLRDIEAINGVVRCNHDKHSIFVVRSPAYPWADIEQKLLWDIIVDHFKLNPHDIQFEEVEVEPHHLQAI